MSQSIIQKLLGFGVVCSLISSFDRADYNLPLFIFAAFLWEFEKFHTRIVYLLLFSFMIDFIYSIYWHNAWKSYQYMSLMHTIILIISLINMLIKIVVMLLTIGNDKEVKRNLQFGIMKDNIINFLTFKNTGDD